MLVAAGDCHYATHEDHEAHEIMLSIQTHDKISNPDRYYFWRLPCVYAFSQMRCLKSLKIIREAVWNSGKIADQCNFDFQTGKLFFPKFEIPQDHTQESYFSASVQ